MDTQSIVALVGIAIGLSGSILYAAYRVGSEIAGFKAEIVGLKVAIAPLVGIPERMAVQETKLSALDTRVEALEQNQLALFDRMGEAVH